MWPIHCEIRSLYVVYNCPVLLTANLSESDTKVFRSTHLIVESESGLSTARSAQLNWLTSTYAFTEKTWLRLLSFKASPNWICSIPQIHHNCLLMLECTKVRFNNPHIANTSKVHNLIPSSSLLISLDSIK